MRKLPNVKCQTVKRCGVERFINMLATFVSLCARKDLSVEVNCHN